MIIHRHTHQVRIQCDGEGQNTNYARTLALCRGAFLYARLLRSVIRVRLAFEKYFLIAFVLVEVSFLALEVTFCRFNNVFSIWIVNGVDCDIRG